MKLNEVNNTILKNRCISIYVSKDDDFFKEKGKLGLSMDFTSQKLQEKSKWVYCGDTRARKKVLKKYGEREILLSFIDFLDAMFGTASIVISSR